MASSVGTSVSITPLGGTAGAGRIRASKVPCLDEDDFGDVWSGEVKAFLLLDLAVDGKSSTSGCQAPGSFMHSR